MTGNPSIGQHRYEALLGLINRRFDIGVIGMDDQSWRATFDLVLCMKRTCDRGRFLDNSIFPLKTIWVNFLAELVRTHYG